MIFNEVLLTLIFTSILASVLYIYIAFKEKQMFMRYWGLSWIAYAVNLFCLFFYNLYDNVVWFEASKLIDIFNMLLLLLGVFAFMHMEIQTYWYRFSLYMVLLAVICIVYGVDVYSYFLPISLFQISITIVICYNILRYWNSDIFNKHITWIMFFLWGMSRAILPLIEFERSFNYAYISEVFLAIALNVCIIAIYINHAREETELSERLYKTLMDNITDVIFYYKLEPYHAFNYITPSITKLTGYTQEKFYDDPRFYVNLVDDKYVDIIEDVFSGEINSDDGHVMEFQTKNGEKFWGKISITVIENDKNIPIALEGSIHDITDMKSAQIQQIKAKESQDLLLSYISHELRTPMTSISGYLDAIEDGVITNDDEIKDAMETITLKTKALKILLDDLDQLSKLGTDQFSFEFMVRSLEEVCSELIQEFDLQAKASPYLSRIDYNIDENQDYSVIVDQGRINQVFFNILNNAIKYAATDTELIAQLSVDTSEENFIVKITNTKGYIQDKDLIYIFNRFYKKKSPNQKKQEGRGLGLAISREIILAHKGTIYAESNEKEGTTFTFTIPLVKEN